MKNKLLLAFVVVFLFFGNFVGKIEAFSDVPHNTYYTNAVTDLSQRQIISGYPDGTFRPNAPITRGQVASIVAKALQLTAPTNASLTFSDVPESHYFYPYISALAEKGIINGYSDGRFGVNDKMTRGQAAKVLALAFELPAANTSSTPFTDIQQSSFKEHIETLFTYKITNGLTNTLYGPNDTLTRANVAVLVQRLEALKQHTPVSITYSTLNATSVQVDYEYEDARDLFVVSNQLEKKQLILTPLKEGTSTVLFQVKQTTGKQSLVKYIVHITKTNGKLSTSLSPSEEIEAARFQFSKQTFAAEPVEIRVTQANGQTTKTVDVQTTATDYLFDFYGKGDFIITFITPTSTEIVNVSLHIKDFTLVGEATFANGKLILTKTELGLPIDATAFTVAHPDILTFTKTASQLVIVPKKIGTTYLQAVYNNKTYTFIVEVTMENNAFITDLYEAE